MNAAPGPTMKVSDVPTRGTTPLPEAEYQRLVDEAVSKGQPRELIEPGEFTAYDPKTGKLIIGPDVHPLAPEMRPANLANPANAALDSNAALGHEIHGHREAALANQTRHESWLEEAQASMRASKFTEGLPSEQRTRLWQDADARFRFQREPGETVYMYMDPVVKSKPPASGPTSGLSAEGLSKVIIDPSLIHSPEPMPSSPSSIKSAPGAASLVLPRPSWLQPNYVPLSAADHLGKLASSSESGNSDETVPSMESGTKISGSPDNSVHIDPATGALINRKEKPFELPGAAFVVSPVGAFAVQAGVQMGLGIAKAMREPQVERVNPNYPPPPGTPQQHADMLNEINIVLSRRAQAEQIEALMAAEAQRHKANIAPVREAKKEMGEAVSATKAHQQQVANREQANQRQQQRQKESQSLIAGYPSRAAGMTVLTFPLKGFERFTSLGSILPESPSAARKAKRALQKMNTDAKNFIKALGEMDCSMDKQNEGQPARRQELLGDQTALQTTNQQSIFSGKEFHKAQDGAAALDRANHKKINEAESAKNESANDKKELASQAEQKKAEADTLYQQMQAWADAHKQARLNAIAETEKRLRAQGFVVTESKE